MDKKKIDVEGYEKKYSEESLFSKVRSSVKAAGIMMIYQSLQLFYVTKSPSCPWKVRLAIFSTLGYFIAPIDLIPDVIPIAGFSDDAIAIRAAFKIAEMYVTEEIKQQARDRIASIFGEEALRELDKKITEEFMRLLPSKTSRE